VQSLCGAIPLHLWNNIIPTVQGNSTTQRLHRYDIITKQDHFINKNDVIIQNAGLAMGGKSSGIIIEIFLQHTEISQLVHLSEKLFLLCGRHLLIFDSEHMNIQAIVNDFNTTHPKLHFTAEI